MKTVSRVTRQSLESVLVCSYSLSGRFGFNFVPPMLLPSLPLAGGTNPLECRSHPQDSPPLISLLLHRASAQGGVLQGAPGAIRAGQGGMAGPVSSGIRQQQLTESNSAPIFARDFRGKCI